MADIDSSAWQGAHAQDATRQAWISDLHRASATTTTNVKSETLANTLEERTSTGMVEGSLYALVNGALKPLPAATYMRPLTGALVGVGVQVGDELVDRGLAKVVGAAAGQEAGNLMRSNAVERIGMTAAAVLPLPPGFKVAGIAGAWLLGKVVNYYEDHHH